jgi:uncharacterized membrane protein YgdD (TMEM256/DUF423 family)
MPTIGKLLLGGGALSLFAATGLGAYASHGLRGLDSQALAAVQTAIDHQFFHSLGLVAVAALIERFPTFRGLQIAGWLLAGGIVLFCGSIYAVRLAGLEALGGLAPAGGGCLMAGWLVLAVSALRLPAPR